MTFRIVVRMSTGQGWHASIVGPDETEHQFDSPFELARFLAWPADRAPRPAEGGLR